MSNNENPVSEITILPRVTDLLETSEHLTRAETQIVSAITEGKRIKEDIQNDNVKPIGLYEDLSQEDYDFAIAEARKNLLERDDFNEIKNLEKDTLVVPDQNYCVVSWVGPTFKAKTDIGGFRIMGAFKTLEKAQKYAQRLNHVDPTYDIGVMEMNLWCLGYPDNSDIILGDNGEMDTVAMEAQRDHQLNEFIIKHKTQLEEAKQLFEVRKRAVRKSKITKEGNEEDAPLDSIPKGVPTQEMVDIHDKESEKWLGDNLIKHKEVEDDDYELDSKVLNFESTHKIPNQEYAIVSFIGYTGKNKRIPICIKGVYANEKEAEERIKKLMYIDDTYDIVPVPLYKWVPCDPDLSTVHQEFKNNRLNSLIEEDEKQKEETLSFHQVRKKYAKPDDKNLIENEYTLDKAKLTFIEPTKEVEEINARDALLTIEKIDSEDIRMKGRMYYENGEVEISEVEISEDEIAKTFSFNRENDTKPIFKDADDQLRELDNKIKNLIITEGITEIEARDRFRIKFDERKYQIDQDDVTISKQKQKLNSTVTDFEGMSEKIDRLKKEGHSSAEIRKIMSGE
jgi:hypothetical protein